MMTEDNLKDENPDEDYENDYQEEEEQSNDYGMGNCPGCGSKKYNNVTRGEHCNDCDYYVYYP